MEGKISMVQLPEDEEDLLANFESMNKFSILDRLDSKYYTKDVTSDDDDNDNSDLIA